MSLCIIAGGKVTKLAITLFTLSWIHSAQKTEWRESWSVAEDGLQLREAMIKGSGAGMEPGPNAFMREGWWVWQPALPRQSHIMLAASGTTPSPWRLCYRDGCIDVGKFAGDEAELRPCWPAHDKAR